MLCPYTPFPDHALHNDTSNNIQRRRINSPAGGLGISPDYLFQTTINQNEDVQRDSPLAGVWGCPQYFLKLPQDWGIMGVEMITMP